MNAPASNMEFRPEAADSTVEDFLVNTGHLPIAERIAAIGARSATIKNLIKIAGIPAAAQELINQQRQLNRAMRQAEEEAAAAAKAEAQPATVSAPAVALEPAATPPAVDEVLPEAQPTTVSAPEASLVESQQATPKRRYRFDNEADALELLPILTKQMHVADDSVSGKHHFAAGEAGLLRIIKNFPHLAGHVERAINHLGISSPRINTQLKSLVDHVRLPSDEGSQPVSNDSNLSGAERVLMMMHEELHPLRPNAVPANAVKQPEQQGRAVTPSQKVRE